MVKSSSNVNKFGHAKDFLNQIIVPLQIEYPKHKLVNENKGRLKYVFYDDLFELSFEFIYMPKKIQVTIEQNTHFKIEKRVAKCDYNLEAVRGCCNKLIEEIIFGAQ